MSEDAHQSGPFNPLEKLQMHHGACGIGYPRCSLCCLHFLAVNARAMNREITVSRRAGATQELVLETLRAAAEAERGPLL